MHSAPLHVNVDIGVVPTKIFNTKIYHMKVS